MNSVFSPEQITTSSLWLCVDWMTGTNKNAPFFILRFLSIQFFSQKFTFRDYFIVLEENDVAVREMSNILMFFFFTKTYDPDQFATFF